MHTLAVKEMDIFSVTHVSRQSRQESWYLVQCKPRQDSRAQENLERQGYECVRPLCIRQVRGGLATGVVSESLFPGYLFINLPESANWAPLRSTRGVARIVSFGTTPMSVSASLVAQLREHAVSAPAVLMKPGDPVRFSCERYRELNAVFLSSDGAQRVVVLINFLNRQQKVIVPLTQLILN
jgi:transcriptional antiterminator RfaH